MDKVVELKYLDELKVVLGEKNLQAGTAPNQEEPGANEVNQPDADQGGADQPSSLSSRIRQSLTSAWTGLKRFFCCKKTAN